MTARPRRIESPTVVLALRDPSTRAEVSAALRNDGMRTSELFDLDGPGLPGPLRELDVVVADGGPGAAPLLREIRRRWDGYIIGLAAVAGSGHRVHLYQAGADDVVPWGASMVEIVLRVNAALRWVRPPTVADVISHGSLRIDRGRGTAIVDGATVELTARELALLVELAEHPRRVFSKAQLLERVWGIESGWQSEHTVVEHISRLRRKLDGDAGEASWITTVRNLGYRFEPRSGVEAELT